MENIIEFKNFTFKYDNLSKPTLKNINLSIKKGEKILIAGSSGSGKSTLGHCLNGLIPFSKKGTIEGELIVDGMLTANASIFELSKKVGTILQDQDCQFVGLSVAEDVAFLDENHNMAVGEMHYRVDRALAAVDMEEFKALPPSELSGGQKQRISLAGLMNSEAEILLLDEPLANLDPASGAKTVKLIEKLHREHDATVIVIEHRIEEILEGDFTRIVVLDRGEIVADGTPNEILKSDILMRYGLREPLYIDALKYSGVDIKTLSALHPVEKVVTPEVRRKVATWCEVEKKNSKTLGEILLNLKDISFSYDGIRKNLEGINLELRKGEIVAILGNNGAGKSTLSKVATGIERNRQGKIICSGKDITESSIMKRSEYIGYVMQNPNHMLTQESVFDEVELGLKLRKVKNSREKTESILKICGLDHLKSWPLTALSYGQKKRVTIAAILALEPEVMILDEPTAGQDHAHYLEFMEFVRELSQRGIGIILITHDMHLALEYADRAVVLSKGKILIDDKPSAVFNRREIMEAANLKETSLAKLAELLEIDRDLLAERFVMHEEGKDV